MAKNDIHTLRLELLEIVKQLDHAIHLAMPPGGNANNEKAQQLCSDMRKRLEDAQ